VSTVTSNDGTIIAYDRTGEGPPLILVAGAFQDRKAMGAYARPLADHFSVYAYDRRGRGDSGDTPPYAIEREIADIAALIDEAGGQAFVFGGSSGAVLALDAVEHGLNIPKLAVYEPPFVVDDSRPSVPDDLVDELASLLAAGRRSEAATIYLTKGAAMPGEAVAQMESAPYWATDVVPVAHTLLYDAIIMAGTMTGGPLPAQRWTNVAAPTLVINGTKSFAWVDAATAALATALPNATRKTFEDEEHEVSPETLAPAMVEFFTS
jgi:pimeloyl-ACP methyl ester carboxylesterase